MRKKEHHTYEVGYGKPPPHTRFKKGQSGNPEGRPKSPKTFDSKIAQELDALLTINMDGEQTTVTRREAVVLRLIKKALGGDARSLRLLLSHIRASEPKEKQPAFIIKRVDS